MIIDIQILLYSNNFFTSYREVNMRKNLLYLLSLVTVLIVTPAWAIPTLQIGAPAGIVDTGDYADYQDALSIPFEEDTAITSGGIIFAAGAYKNNAELLIGGQYTDPDDASVQGKNWSDFGFNTAFNSARAVLMATIPDGSLGSEGSFLTVNGSTSFYSTATYKDGFDTKNNHAPIVDQDYFFFDIGDFARNENAVPDFADETGAATGEIKTLAIATAGFDWIHFDLLAIITDTKGQSTFDMNPGSHDVTRKDPGGGGGGGFEVVPEPGTFILFGAGLLGLGLWGARRKS
jgi:hypothetical protein